MERPPSRRQDWDDMVLVGRIARPHGLRGNVLIQAETDFVEERFAIGATVWTRMPEGDRQLKVASARVQNGRPVVGFEGMSRIEDVESLKGLELRIPEEALHPLEPGVYYAHQLVGCTVEALDGSVLGVVRRVDGGGGSSRLVVEGARGEVLVPLAVDICVDIDIARRTIQVNPPDGLVNLNDLRGEKGARRRRRSHG